jgi:hypothetical protein
LKNLISTQYTLKKPGIERKFLNLVKEVYFKIKPTMNIVFIGKRIRAFPKIRSKAMVLELLVSAIRQEK